MRYLTLSEVLKLHRLVIAQSGGADGIRNLGSLESAVVQPQMTFGGNELYPSLVEKAAALCFSLVIVDDAESLFLKLAAGEVERDELVAWITANLSPLSG